ncbi:MAG: flotillin family protein [Actinobacteria bacterium]|nr:flotillin family protein [Actinomycetota bacterium]MCG2807609.1 flotillin family protein [Coriobacteriia bacterium]
MGALEGVIWFGLWSLGVVVGAVVLWFVLGVRIIRSDKVGIVEKWWSPKGSLTDNIIALHGEAGYQPQVLRGGVHFRTPFMYRVHVMPLITIPQGKIGYVFSRDGEPLGPAQTLARVIDSAYYQDVRAFFENGGQRGPQRQILREGTYAFNLAQFIIITEGMTYFLPMGNKGDIATIQSMAQHLQALGGFDPVVIRGADDKTGIVTVHDGPSLPMGDIIAPAVGDTPDDPHYHNNFQDPEAFLAAGFRGRQYQVLTEGTYFINRLFATIELINKMTIPVGYAGVVVSYIGPKGKDISGDEYRHGELVAPGNRGVWNEALLPGKYAFNTYAGTVVMVPTTNIILKWIATETGGHSYDENLSEVELITRDAFEPRLPLSVVIHIDYRKAPLVIQRFGDIKMLVNQTLDPMVSAYFKNIGQTKTIIELIQQRSEIQQSSSTDMKEKFGHYNLELEEVLIGTPRSAAGDDKIEQILMQLRDRQVAVEKLETFERQRVAADKERELKQATAIAEQQTMLTQSEINIQVQENTGRAELQRAAQDADRMRTLAKADADKVKLLASGEAERVTLIAQADARKIAVTAEADATRITLTGEADARRIKAIAEARAEEEARVGVGKAIAIDEQVRAYGGPQLQLMQDVMTKIATAIETSKVQIVPSTVVNMGGGEGDGAASSNAFGLLMAMLSTEKLGEMTTKNAPADPAQREMVAAIKADLRTTMTRPSKASAVTADMAVEPKAPKDSAL